MQSVLKCLEFYLSPSKRNKFKQKTDLVSKRKLPGKEKDHLV